MSVLVNYDAINVPMNTPRFLSELNPFWETEQTWEQRSSFLSEFQVQGEPLG